MAAADRPPPRPGLRVTPTRTLWSDLARLDRRFAGRWMIVVVVVANVMTLTAAIAPFALWHGIGPQRFDDLAGVTHPDPIDPDELASSGRASDRIAPDVPLNLGEDVIVTLVFSVGSRGMTAEEAARLRVQGFDERGADGLTDTMILVVADPASGQVAMLSLPRDLWLFERGHRVNSSFNLHGTQAFVKDVANVTGLPIHHVVRVNFTAFADLVDRIGGVALRVRRPLADLYSVLYVPEPGCWRFKGADALAYVRSRHTLTRRDGDWVSDATASDFGRITRQQQVLGAAWEQLRGPQIVTRIPDLLTVAREGLVIDQDLGIQALRDLAGAFRSVSAGAVESYTLPTTGQRIGAAAAQVVRADAARSIIERLRSWPPRGDLAALAPAGGATVLAAGARPVPASTLLAATDARPATAAPTIQLDPSCTVDGAYELPDPNAPLAAIGVGRTPDQWTPPPEDPSETPTPSETAPSEEASPEPSDEPSDEPIPDPGPTPLPGPSETPSIILPTL